jgi:methyltransferase (TIGR00027 family)
MTGASKTGQAVAVVRAELERPWTPDGDPRAQRVLSEGMRGSLDAALRASLVARTKFFDDQLLQAVSRGVNQIVVVGAGYDDRGLRFRSPGVRFFEIDHPETQVDKLRRLASMKADMENLHLVPADFRRDDIREVLASSGHDPRSSSLFLCEGVIVYLDEATVMGLLRGLKSCATAESTLAVSLAVHPEGIDSEMVVATANAARRTGVTEPWRTILPQEAHLALVSDAGWRVRLVVDASEIDSNARPGRSLFVEARAGTTVG